MRNGYSLAGEIDESTIGGLAGKLAEIAAGLDEVHLDLAALDYSDLAGLRVIVQLAGHVRWMWASPGPAAPARDPGHRRLGWRAGGGGRQLGTALLSAA